MASVEQFYPSIIGLEFSFPLEPSLIRSGDLGQYFVQLVADLFQACEVDIGFGI